MSDAPATDPTAPEMPAATWPPLEPFARRALGVLIEKQKTSKSVDAYPMSLNAVVTGCNQKSNRDPVYDLDEDEVEEALLALNRHVYVVKVQGGRVERWRHLLYEQWKVTKVELAVLAELLLRGPQTEGDLRGRAARMDDIADLDELRAVLKALSGRNFVVYLTPAGRGAVVTHGFHTPEEMQALVDRYGAGSGAFDAVATTTRVAASAAVGTLEARLAEALDEIAKLKQRVARLEERVS